MDSNCVQTLAENYPNNRARSFLHWFTYSDNSIDGQSKKKAYTLIESGLLDSMKIWLDLIFKARLKLCVDWSKIDKKAYLAAMRRSTTDARAIKSLLQGAMTDKIDDREMFMKGIDYSYYYEQSE